MRTFFLIFLLTLTVCAQNLIWHDEFDGSSLDTTKWNFDSLGKRMSAINTPDMVSVSNGTLKIFAATVAGKNQTAILSTEDKFEALYGYWEARIKFNDAPATWSAFWLYNHDVPYRRGSEIDIVEHREVDINGLRLAAGANQGVHWNGYDVGARVIGVYAPDLGLDFGFHIYGVEWSTSGYKFYIDGKLILETHEGKSYKPEFIVLSTEIDDGGWAGWMPKTGYDRITMEVDYVRVFDGKP